jgi:hypothetical protein
VVVLFLPQPTITFVFLVENKLNVCSSQFNTTTQQQSGNIDLTNRPKVSNPDGSYSTVRTIGIEIDGGRHVNIPTVINGKVVSNEEAINYFKKTGQHLGMYKNQKEADAAAKQLHTQQETYYGQ